MIRTTIIPSNKSIVLVVPEEYVGKKIEVLMFDTEEVNQPSELTVNALKPSQLRGFLSKDRAKAMQQHIEQSRGEWDTL